MKICASCGKEFYVFYPELWTYKERYGDSIKKWFCSYTCMRADESRKEDEKTVKQLSESELRYAGDIALKGNCPYEFLKQIGVKNVNSSWNSIINRLQKIDKDKYADLPRQYRKSPEKKEEPPKAAVIEEEQEKPAKNEITKPVNYDGFDVCCIRNNAFGELYRDKMDEYVEWTTPGGQVVTLDLDGWKKFAEDLPRALRVLGVNV